MSEPPDLLMLLAQTYEAARERRSVGNSPGAVSRYRKAVELAEQHGDRQWAVEILSELGEMHQQAYELGEARRTYGEALARAQEAGDPAPIARLERRLAQVALLEGDLGAARAGFRRAAERYEQQRFPLEAAERRLDLARCSWDAGERGAAVDEWCRGWVLFEQAGPGPASSTADPMVRPEPGGRETALELLRAWSRRVKPDWLRDRMRAALPDGEQLWEQLREQLR